MTSADTTGQSQPTTPAPTTKRLKKRVTSWRFWVPMALQLALILPIPLRNTYTELAGETIILKTVPVDPYNWLQGYYQVLSYETISDQEEVAKLSGGEFLENYYSDRRPFYLVFAQVPMTEAGDNPGDNPGASSAPGDWQPVRVSKARPEDVADNELFIKGYAEGGFIRYNLERYYMPEELRNELNATISDLRREDPQAVKMEVKVDRFGGAVAVALLMDGKRFEF